MEESMLEFPQSYESQFKPKFMQKVSEFFQSLVDESGINADENRKSAAQYRKIADEVTHLEGQLKKYRGWRGFFIFLTVLSFFAAVVLFFMAFDSSGAYQDSAATLVLVATGCVLLGVGSLLLITLYFNKRIKSVDAVRAEKQKLADNQYNLCMKQLESLHKLLWRSKLYQLIEETLPTVKFDQNFNMKRYDILNGKYGLTENREPDQSTVGVISGEMLGNPFVEERRFTREMGTQVYTGTKLITWSETYTDSQGHTRTQMRSETLVATLSKPKPFYRYVTQMIFGCEAAPNLSFSHQPTHAEDLSEKALERKVKRDSKALQRQARKAATSGTSNFTEMANQQFDALFNAEDRDNEVEFRLMFTPLAQKNMLYLMTMPQPYGDDFHFVKSKMLNFVQSEHGQSWQFDENNSMYMKYDVDLCKQAMESFYLHFFQNFYFEVAPLLSVPLYQQHKSLEYIYQREYSRNYTSFESEVLANCFDTRKFAHPDTETDVILKTDLLHKGDGVDELLVAAYSYRTEQRVDFVTKLGGDGRFHEVPVHWVEYIPLKQVSEMALFDNAEQGVDGDCVSKHGLFARFVSFRASN